ncbi:MAG: CoB--CoM heterodisulfide reductase iron-sulfur subunit B family protein [Candidatus Bipolaricaulia bacterium]
MRILYYPGCSLKTQAEGFDRSARAAMAALGVELVELERWNCCGAVSSLVTDDLMRQLAPIRNLIRVQEAGEERLTAACAMCYNTLKRANLRVQEHPEELAKINAFLDEEPAYQGKVRVLHLLELLRDELGFEAVAKRVTRPLEGLKVSPYYGCLLLRPRGVGLDDPENPSILEELVRALGAEPVESPLSTQCCGSYHTATHKEVVAKRAHKILSDAAIRGAEIIITSCPLCSFNLDNRQRLVREIYDGFAPIPVLYFTELMALAFGLGESSWSPEQHYVDPRPLLLEHQLLRA